MCYCWNACCSVCSSCVVAVNFKCVEKSKSLICSLKEVSNSEKEGLTYKADCWRFFWRSEQKNQPSGAETERTETVCGSREWLGRIRRDGGRGAEVSRKSDWGFRVKLHEVIWTQLTGDTCQTHTNATQRHTDVTTSRVQFAFCHYEEVVWGREFCLRTFGCCVKGEFPVFINVTHFSEMWFFRCFLWTYHLCHRRSEETRPCVKQRVSGAAREPPTSFQMNMSHFSWKLHRKQRLVLLVTANCIKTFISVFPETPQWRWWLLI